MLVPNLPKREIEMKMVQVRALMALFIAVGMTPPALAGEGDFGYYELNNGDGTCSTVSCGQNGCIVVDIHPCPREVSGD